MFFKFLKITNFFCIKQLLKYKSTVFLLAGIIIGYLFISYLIKTPKINYVTSFKSNKPSNIPRPLFYNTELNTKKNLLIALINDSDSNGVQTDLDNFLYDTEFFNFAEYQVLEHIIKNSIEKYNLFFIITKSTFFIHNQVFLRNFFFN